MIHDDSQESYIEPLARHIAQAQMDWREHLEDADLNSAVLLPVNNSNPLTFHGNINNAGPDADADADLDSFYDDSY